MCITGNVISVNRAAVLSRTVIVTLFKACTCILGAPMSWRSLSASYFRSLETLNLEERWGGWGKSRSLMWSQWCEFCKAWWIWRSLTIVLSSFPLRSFLEWCQPLCGLCPLQRRPLWGSQPAGCSAESLHVAVECYKEVNINGLLMTRKYKIFANNQCEDEFTMSLWWNCRGVCEIRTEMPLLNWMKITFNM